MKGAKPTVSALYSTAFKGMTHRREYGVGRRVIPSKDQAKENGNGAGAVTGGVGRE